MSHLRVTRALSILGLGVLISACSPPNEQPSDLKVDTATGVRTTAATTDTPTSAAAGSTVSAADLPGVIDCVGTPELRPDRLALACADNNDRIVDITWSEWTPTGAEGTATRETNDCDPSCAQGSIERTRNVEVELSEPVESSQGLVFTRLIVDGETVIL